MKISLVAIRVDIVARGVFWQRDCYHLMIVTMMMMILMMTIVMMMMTANMSLTYPSSTRGAVVAAA